MEKGGERRHFRNLKGTEYDLMLLKGKMSNLWLERGLDIILKLVYIRITFLNI